MTSVLPAQMFHIKNLQGKIRAFNLKEGILIFELLEGLKCETPK